MQRLISLALLLITTISGFSQAPPGGAPGRKFPPPTNGRIYGKLVDDNGKAIRDASVVLLQRKMDTVTRKSKDVLLKGTSTAANGEFNLEDLPVFGPLKLTITAVGYQPVNTDVAFTIGNFDKDLGKIVASKDAKQLEEVVVTGTTSKLKMDIDKKVFNVGQNIVSAGGTAVDVMRNVPSVNVDLDGNVTLRNATPQLYIDGRPTTLTLDQIPADAIESVEVITNPSAKFDASGGNAGILNIVLKKNKKSGYNGSINAGIDKRGAINGGANLSVRQDKFNVSVSGFRNQMKNVGTSTTQISSLLTDPNLLVNQAGTNRTNGSFLFGRAGVDYFATNRTTISLAAIRVHGEFSPNDFLRADSSWSDGSAISYSERNTNNKREFNATGVQGGFKYQFPRKGEELTADFNIFSGKFSGNALYNTNIYTEKDGELLGNIRQQILGTGRNKFRTFQADYVRPLYGSAKIETGVRAQLRNMNNGQQNYYFDEAAGAFVKVPSSSTNYENKDNVYAAYLSFSDKIKNFGYKVGLRAESSDYVGELTDTKQTFENKYPISLFPSLFLSQKLKHEQEIQLSYTRRVNRPFFLQVIPFIDSTDQLNWTRGNAGLKPEFTNSLEASYSKTYAGKNNFLASVYYKYTTNLITRYLDTITVAGVQHPINTYINANSSRSVGAELTSVNVFTKWWDVTSNVNIYNSRINTDNIAGTSQEALWSWFAKVNSNFKLPEKFKLQLSGTYQSKTNLPISQSGGFGGPGGPFGGTQTAAQGYIKSSYGVDVAIQKSFLKNDVASVTLNVSDIFRTRRYDQYSESAYYIQNGHRLGDVPMFRLNFSFRFGQMDMSLFKRKNTKGESEGMQGAMQGIGQ